MIDLVKNNLLLMCFVFALAACGGGGSGGSSDSNVGSDPESVRVIEGGTLNNPSVLQAQKKHRISENRGSNVFVYNAEEGDLIIIHSILQQPLTGQQQARCSASGEQPGIYSTDIHIFDDSRQPVGGTCREQLFHRVDKSGTYIFEFDYGSNNTGVFWFTVIKPDDKRDDEGSIVGSPNHPQVISQETANGIPSNPFLGFYQAYLQAGEKLIMSATLDPAFSPQDRSRCAASSQSKSFKTYFAVYDVNFVELAVQCGDYYEFTAPKEGVYVIHPYFYAKSSGSFIASKF